MWFNLNHLKEANLKAGTQNSGYWGHFLLAISEFFFLLFLTIASLIHAFFPWVFDFKLLEWRILRLKHLKEKLPNDELLKKVKFDD